MLTPVWGEEILCSYMLDLLQLYDRTFTLITLMQVTLQFSALALALIWDYRTMMTTHHDNSNTQCLVCPGLWSFPMGVWRFGVGTGNVE